MEKGSDEVKKLEEKLQRLEHRLRNQKSKAKRRELRKEINELKVDLGWMLMDYGDYERAFLLYRSLPWSTYGEMKYNGLARALIEMGFYVEARMLLEAGLRTYPDSYPLWIAMACLYETTGDYFESLECLEIALEFSPYDDSTALYNKSLVLMKMGCYKDAQEIIDDLIERYPEDTKFLTQKGLLALEMGYLEEALRYYQRAMEMWLKDQDLDNGIAIYSGLCSVYMELGMKKEAMEVALEGLKRFPDKDPVLYHNVGAVFFEMGWRKEALEVLKEGVRKFPGDEEMRKFLKEIEDDLDDPDDNNKSRLGALLLLMALLFRKVRKR